MIDFTTLSADQIYTGGNGTQLAYVSREWGEESRRVDRQFGFRDTKGREFGAMVRIGTQTRTPRSPATSGYGSLSDWLGTKIEVRPHATRGGQLYGAGQSSQFFDTMEQAEAYVARYFRDAEKRASKNKARA